MLSSTYFLVRYNTDLCDLLPTLPADLAVDCFFLVSFGCICVFQLFRCCADSILESLSAS